MHSNTTNEIAVGGSGLIMAVVAVDDPALKWLVANWIGVSLVAVLTMSVAGVTCILSPAPTPRMTVGRILASGIFGAAVSVIAGSIHSSGSGPAAIAGIVLGCGIGGWMAWVFLIEVMTSMKESPEARRGFIGILRNFAARFAGEARKPASDSQLRLLTTEERVALRVPEKRSPASFDEPPTDVPKKE